MVLVMGVAFVEWPLPAREIIFHQAEAETCRSWALLENPQPIYVFGSMIILSDPRAAGSRFMGWSRCRSCYPDYPPGVKRVYWKKPSGTPTGSTVARLGLKA